MGLPGVIAHGMLTMALAGRLLTQWVGDPAAIRSYGMRFTRPVVVPDDDEGATVEITGKVSEIVDAPDGSRVARVAITAVFDGEDRARAGAGRGRSARLIPGSAHPARGVPPVGLPRLPDGSMLRPSYPAPEGVTR